MRRSPLSQSLTGAFGLGVFLVGHLLVNASALRGERGYDAVAGAIHRSGFNVLFDLLIFFVLGAHVIEGIKLLRRSSTPDPETERYSVTKDARVWVLQRMSSVFVAAFLLGHLFELRFRNLFFGLPKGAYYTVLITHLSTTRWGIPWIAFSYLAGIAAVLFHFSNGLFAAITSWRQIEDARGRKRVRRLTLAVGAMLFLLSGLTVMSLATGTRLLPPPDANSAPCPPSTGH